MYCQDCGKENNITARFCKYCGAELDAASDDGKDSNPVPEKEQENRQDHSVDVKPSGKRGLLLLAAFAAILCLIIVVGVVLILNNIGRSGQGDKAADNGITQVQNAASTDDVSADKSDSSHEDQNETDNNMDAEESKTPEETALSVNGYKYALQRIGKINGSDAGASLADELRIALFGVNSRYPYVIYNNTLIKKRKGNDVSSTGITRLIKGEAVEVFGIEVSDDNDFWYRIRYKGEEGYAHWTDIGHAMNVQTRPLFVGENDMRIFDEPGYQSSEIGVIPGGAVVELFGIVADPLSANSDDPYYVYWYLINYEGKVGFAMPSNLWVMPANKYSPEGIDMYCYVHSLIYAEADTNSEIVGAILVGDTVKVHSYSRDMCRISYYGKNGYVPVVNLIIRNGYYAFEDIPLTSTPKFIYKSSDFKSEIIGMIEKGDEYYFIDMYKSSDQCLWIAVKYKGLVGFIAEFESGTVFDDVTVTITGKDVNVRGAPTTDKPRIGKAEQNQKYRLKTIERDSTYQLWYGIDYNGQSGYILAEYAAY